MSAQSRTTLKQQFSDDQLATGPKFSNLIDSFKLVQSPVSNPTASGNSISFVESITQNAEGVISVVRRYVDFSGYQTISGMAGYQTQDKQEIYHETVTRGDGRTYTHKKGHYPTVRVLDSTNTEISPLEFKVTHSSVDEVKVTFANVAGNVTVVLD